MRTTWRAAGPGLLAVASQEATYEAGEQLGYCLFLQIVAVLFQQLLDLGINHHHAIRLVGVAVVILLVIVLGWIEVGEGQNFRDYRISIAAGFINGLFR